VIHALKLKGVTCLEGTLILYFMYVINAIKNIVKRDKMKSYEDMMIEFRNRANKKILEEEDRAREQWLKNLKELGIK